MATMQTVVRRTDIDPDDPYTYLYVMGEWYCYNPDEKPLGSGAMGTVFEGFRVNNSQRIAVKKVKPNFARVQGIRERAKQEASLSFRHPNLVEMIGYCELVDPNGPVEAYILSSFVEGISIGEYVKEHLAGIEDRTSQITNLISQVLDALIYIHSRGVVHRDIKPSNIMVEYGGKARLMDLGIARMNGGNKYSQNGFIGTPQYSAPEQITSKSEISASTDIYAVGVTLYELLTGTNPFDAPQEAVILAQQLTKTLPAHSAIPRRLMRVIWKATNKETHKRYLSAEEMKSDILKAAKPGANPIQSIMEWITDNKLFFTIGVIVILVLIIIILLFK